MSQEPATADSEGLPCLESPRGYVFHVCGLDGCVTTYTVPFLNIVLKSPFLCKVAHTVPGDARAVLCLTTHGWASVQRAERWPSTLGDALEWLRALDYLIVEPSPDLLAFILSRLPLASTFEDLLRTRLPADTFQKRRTLYEHVTEGIAAILPAQTASPVRPTRPREDYHPPPREVPGEVQRVPGNVSVTGIWHLNQFLLGSPPHLLAARGALTALWDMLPDSEDGAHSILSSPGVLVERVGRDHAQWLFYRAIRAACLSEARDPDKAAKYIVPSWLYAWRKTYAAGGIYLSSFVPHSGSRDRIYLLPHVLGKEKVSRCPLRLESLELRAHMEREVPWLGALWPRLRGRAYITGSFLCESATGPIGGVGRWHISRAADVDIFCEPHECLEELVDAIHTTMAEYFCSQRVERNDTSASKATLSVIGPRNDDIAPAAFACDVYRNTSIQVARYHVPQVRAFFDGESLRVFPTCAIAWVTRVNTDFHCVRGKKNAFDIIARKWLASFNFCLDRAEQRMLCVYLRTFYPLALRAWDVTTLWEPKLYANEFGDFSKRLAAALGAGPTVAQFRP